MATKRLPGAKKTPGTNLDRRKAAIPLIAQGLSNEEVASKLKCHSTTISRWRHEADTKAAVDALLADGIEAARRVLQSGARDAAQALLAKTLDTNSKGDAGAAKILLGIAGLSATTKTETTVTVTPIADEAVPQELIAALSSVIQALTPAERAPLRLQLEALLAAF